MTYYGRLKVNKLEKVLREHGASLKGKKTALQHFLVFVLAPYLPVWFMKMQKALCFCFKCANPKSNKILGYAQNNMIFDYLK